MIDILSQQFSIESKQGVKFYYRGVFRVVKPIALTLSDDGEPQEMQHSSFKTRLMW